jgi:pyruvate/2-oxoglutarate dehydrogenase complex dihydrolipoamide dehydrogenase (E3) component
LADGAKHLTFAPNSKPFKLIQMKEYDAIIIGFGKGGKTLAADLAKRGKKVAIIERSDQMYGGTCINIGCIPTKTLVHQAKIASRMADAPFEERALYYKKAMEEKTRVTSMLRNKNYHNLADNPNVTVINGIGSFAAADTVAVNAGTETHLLKSSQIFINTGSESVIPNIEGITDNPFVHNSTSLLEVTNLPKRFVIIGGGYIGLEFASMYASFGSEVTVLESYPILIGREDRDIADSVKAALEKKGITFILNAKVTGVTHTTDHATVAFENAKTGEHHMLDAEAVLLATGRKPRTEDLYLQAAGVETDGRGAIIVNEHLVTTNLNIRALGDVKGGLQFTYISLDDYRIVRDDLFGQHKRSTTDRDPVSYSVFIDPPLARIGISEEEASRQSLDVTVKKLPVMAIPRAKTLGETDGLLKAIIDNTTNQILGCTIFAPEASEVINIVAMAMKTRQSYTFLRDFIFTHPSMSEALNDLFS